ncbi:Ig-like domain-containing protein [Aliivibrio salmonicida]|uniref:Ig-like domain-containing protein n=1 Tax=Aliivibrio salmonicida TaxID=40269 RepID=UPI00406C5AE3
MMMMKQKTALLAMALALAGCNAEDDKSSPQATPPPPTASVSQAPSIIANVIIGEVKHIPIYQSVQARSGQLLSISSVRQLNNELTDCPEPKINGLELIYTQDTAGVCDYEYTVTDSTTDSTTTARLISSASSGTAKLADIASSTIMGTDKTIAVTVAEGDTITIVTVLGAGTAIANESSIEFSPGNTGLARVVYTVSNNSGATPSSKVGVINITVSELDNGNTVLVTPNMTFTALPGESKILTLDITDADADDNPQLISVMSTDGVIAAPQATDIDADYFTNKNFTFTAALPGSYTVFYTAHDHRGGYNTGRASVTVAGDIGIMAKDASFYRVPSAIAYDFKIDLRSYITAPDMSKVDYVSAVFDDATSSTIDRNPAHIIAPTKATPVLTYKYQGANKTGLVAIKYTVKNNTGQTSGRVFINIGSTRAIITTVGTTTDVDYEATVTATSTCTDCVQAKTEYTWTYAGSTHKSNTYKVPDGVAGESLTLEATPYGTKGESGVSKSITYSYPLITMTSTIVKNNANADNVDTNIVSFKVTKADGQGLVGQRVTATVDKSTASLVADTKHTDSNGEVQINVKSTAGGEVITTGGVTRGGFMTDIAAATDFEPSLLPGDGVVGGIPGYCHQFPGVRDLNCLPTMTVASGKIFTANMSQQFMRASYSTLSYTSLYNENGGAGHVGAYVRTTHAQSLAVCNAFNTEKQYGRNNWRLPAKDELAGDLPERYGNMFIARGWPIGILYWSSTRYGSSGSYIEAVDLRNGYAQPNNPSPSVALYASCVSNR